MRLGTYLRERLVVHGLEAGDRGLTLQALGRILEEEGLVPSGEEVARALAEREDAHSTALGQGIALPHAVLPFLSDPLLLVASTVTPVPFGPEEEDGVDLLFLLLSPPGRQGEHIKLLARICRLVRHPEFLEELRGAEDSETLYQAILDEDSRHV